MDEDFQVDLKVIAREETIRDDHKYIQAGDRMNIESYLFLSYENKGDMYRFKLLDGSYVTKHESEIGAIRPNKHGVADNHNLLLGSKTIEDLLENKALTDFLLRINDPVFTRVSSYLPKTHSHGFGILPDAIIGYLIQDFDKIVRKNAAQSRGIGVSILDFEEAMQSLSNSFEPMDSDEYLAKQAVILRLTRQINIEDFLTLYQEFIPSVPIINSATGLEHDGCSRVIVYSDKKPEVLGMKWRLSPEPLNSDSNNKFLANLSKNAIPTDVSPEHYSIMEKAAIEIVQGFEDRLNSMSEGMKTDLINLQNSANIGKERALDFSHHTVLEMIRMSFWGFQYTMADKLQQVDKSESTEESIKMQQAIWKQMHDNHQYDKLIK